MNPNAMRMLEKNGLADEVRRDSWPYLTRETRDRNRAPARHARLPTALSGGQAVAERARASRIFWARFSAACRRHGQLRRLHQERSLIERRPPGGRRRHPLPGAARGLRGNTAATWDTARIASSWTTSRTCAASPSISDAASASAWCRSRRSGSTCGPLSIRRATSSRCPTCRACFRSSPTSRCATLFAPAAAASDHHHRHRGALGRVLDAGPGRTPWRLGARHDAEHRPGRRHGDGRRRGARRRARRQ